MRGFPRTLNTKKDYYNLITDYPDETKAALRQLMDSRMAWVVTGRAVGKGITDATHKVVVSEDTNGKEVSLQMEFKENADAQFFKMGWTVQEAEAFINTHNIPTIVEGV